MVTVGFVLFYLAALSISVAALSISVAALGISLAALGLNTCNDLNTVSPEP